MLKKLLVMLGIGLAANGAASAGELHKPYEESHLNSLYNLLFCDDLSLFARPERDKGGDLWATLLAEKPDKVALRKIADDEANEGRVRALAYNRLRAAGEEVPPKKVLGVIVEIPMEEGLDVLAAFSEGGVRYLNHSGKVLICEGEGHPAEALAKALVAAAQPTVDRIGPWTKQRLPPPKGEKARVTFIVSDGLYFGEGPLDALQKDPMAGPIMEKAAQLLKRVVEAGTK